jgi:hypothetical protein
MTRLDFSAASRHAAKIAGMDDDVYAGLMLALRSDGYQRLLAPILRLGRSPSGIPIEVPDPLEDTRWRVGSNC